MGIPPIFLAGTQGGGGRYITLFLLSNFYKKSACISASASVTPEGLEPSTQ